MAGDRPILADPQQSIHIASVNGQLLYGGYLGWFIIMNIIITMIVIMCIYDHHYHSCYCYSKFIILLLGILWSLTITLTHVILIKTIAPKLSLLYNCYGLSCIIYPYI